MQSTYRRFHSTKTTVTEMFNDLLLAADGGKMSALCLLDLAAAFDCRLERRGVVLERFRSYLSGRTFRVVFDGRLSSTVYIVFSVPQGSVLGWLLFTV